MEEEIPKQSVISSNYGIRSKKWFSYIILAFSALNVIFLGGKRRAFGIFVAQLHNGEFNTTSLAELNWIGDSYAALGYMTTAASTAFILKINRRYRLSQLMGSILILVACLTSSIVPNAHWLFLTHTILHGCGSSLILSTVGLIVNDYFDKSHPLHILATILVSGGSVASIIFIQLYATLITEFDWRRAFVILGIIYFIVNSSACFVFVRSNKHRHSNNEKDSKINKFSLKDYLSVQKHSIYGKSPRLLLVLWLCDRIITSIVTYGLLLNLADLMFRYDKVLKHSTILTDLFAVGEAFTYLIGAIITGFTKNWLHNRLRYILLVSTFLLSGSLILWEFTQPNYHDLSGKVNISHFLALISGLCLGPSITFLFPAGEELTGLPGHMAYPFSLFGMGVGMATSPFFTAVVAQIFNYQWYFLVQGILIFFKFLCLLASCILIHFNTKRHSPINKKHNSLTNGKIKSTGIVINGNKGPTWKRVPTSDDKIHLLNDDNVCCDDDEEEEEDYNNIDVKISKVKN